ncbi:MAG: endonuclease/exonuclease/phosphatase family protein [Planctomycetales bacterium]
MEDQENTRETTDTDLGNGETTDTDLGNSELSPHAPRVSLLAAACRHSFSFFETWVDAVCAFSLLGFFDRYWYVFHLLCHFRLQYFVFLATGVVVLLIGKSRKRAAVAAVFACLNLSVIAPLYFSDSPRPARNRVWRAATINVERDSGAYRSVEQFVREETPDILALQETRASWLDELAGLEKDYPYSVRHPLPGYFGLLLYSRVPIESHEIRMLGGDVPVIMGKLRLEDETLTVFVVHTRAPLGPVRSQKNQQQLEELGEWAAAESGNVLLIGDFNTSGWSARFQDLTRKTGLRDSRKGFGVQPSWPTILPLIWIPIDHVLVSKRLVVRRREVGKSVGSDHFPVLVDFSLAPPLSEK